MIQCTSYYQFRGDPKGWDNHKLPRDRTEKVSHGQALRYFTLSIVLQRHSRDKRFLLKLSVTLRYLRDWRCFVHQLGNLWTMSVLFNQVQ